MSVTDPPVLRARLMSSCRLAAAAASAVCRLPGSATGGVCACVAAGFGFGGSALSLRYQAHPWRIGHA